MLECSNQTKSVGCRTRINVVVDTAECFRIQTVILGDYERILNSAVETEAKSFFAEILPSVTKSDVVYAEEVTVAEIVVAQVEVLTCFAGEVNIGVNKVGQVSVNPSAVQHVALRKYVVVNFSTEVSAKSQAEVPVLIVERVAHRHSNLRVFLITEYAVVVVDCAVTVLVNEFAFNRFAGFVVNLLIEIVSKCRIAYFMSLNEVVRTATDSCNCNESVGVVGVVKFSDFVLVPTNVVVQVKSLVTIGLALIANSRPMFLIVPTLIVISLVVAEPIGTVTLQRRSLVSRRYQSKDALIRLLRNETSIPAL